MLWEKEKTTKAMNSLMTSPSGLSSEEAKKRIAEYGENTITEEKKRSFLSKLLASLCDVMTIVLLLSAAVSFIVAEINGENSLDGFIILAIVLLNGIFSVIQESKAEKALDALKNLSSPEAKVIRDGKEIHIPSRLVTVGDIVLLEKGCSIPADGRLIQSTSLVTDESALTGESHGVEKTSAAGSCTVYSGTTVLGGHGKAVVTEVGMKTKVGSIASMLNSSVPPKTPLQTRLSKTSAVLGNGALIICLAIFAISVLRGAEPSKMFLTSVSLAVAAIPEGLPAIVTVMLSMGVTDLAKHRAVVKKLPAVEALGCATVICSDKTGTLTQNKMTVTEVSGEKALVARLFALCNRVSSPTEQALYNYSASVLPDLDEYLKARPIIDEIPFDSEKRIMATLHKERGGYTAVIKGAPEEVEKYLSHGFDKEEIRKMTSSGLRVLCVGYAKTTSRPSDMLSLSYIPAGFAGMMDIPRPEAKRAILLCKKAGIKTVMITGDHKDTAEATARLLGITGQAKTEEELKSLSKSQKEKEILKTRIFARSTPEFKVEIVETYRKNGDVVAMTGDGVNDAPALKNAHIGCAMGKNGTDVAREAGDIVLTDDNFATIVEAVKIGRGIYANIRRAVHFLISCNIGEIITVFGAMLLSLPTPLAAVQLLWVNLVTDSLPAIAIGMEKPRNEIMNNKPVKPESSLFSRGEGILIVLEGLTVGVLSISAYLLGGSGAGSTMAFGVLSMSQLFHSFNMRSSKPLLVSGVNMPLIFAFVFSLAAQISVMVLPPLMKIFGTVPLSFGQWRAVILLSASILAVGEISKLLRINATRS